MVLFELPSVDVASAQQKLWLNQLEEARVLAMRSEFIMDYIVQCMIVEYLCTKPPTLSNQFFCVECISVEIGLYLLCYIMKQNSLS